jgi:hypothetical protein
MYVDEISVFKMAVDEMTRRLPDDIVDADDAMRSGRPGVNVIQPFTTVIYKCS